MGMWRQGVVMIVVLELNIEWAHVMSISKKQPQVVKQSVYCRAFERFPL